MSFRAVRDMDEAVRLQGSLRPDPAAALGIVGCRAGAGGRVAGGGPRDESCARREARGRMKFRAVREGIG